MCMWKNRCCSLQVGMEVAPQLKDNLNRNFFDLLGTFQQISGESVQNQLVVQRVELPEYLTLYSPAINWILQCIAYRAPEANVSSILSPFIKLKKRSDFSAKIKSMFFVGFFPVFVVGDDGEVQDPGQQVSAFETQEVKSMRTVTYPGTSWRCVCGSNSALLLNSVMRAFRPEFVAARATDFISMIKDCDEAGFPKVRRQEPAVWFPASMMRDVKNACCCGDVSSTSFLALWDAVLPVPTLLRQRGWAFWTKRGRWSPKCAVLRCNRNTAVVMEMFVPGSRCLTWGLFCFYFRITSTVLKSGWSSRADTLQWESWIIKNRGAVTCFSDLNNSSLFFYQKREVNTILADIIKHMTPDRAFEDAYPQVSSTFAHTVFIQTWTLSSSHCLCFHSCSQPSGRSSNTSTTSLSSSP